MLRRKLVAIAGDLKIYSRNNVFVLVNVLRKNDVTRNPAFKLADVLVWVVPAL